jgi:hypothetical protein
MRMRPPLPSIYPSSAVPALAALINDVTRGMLLETSSDRDKFWILEPLIKWPLTSATRRDQSDLPYIAIALAQPLWRIAVTVTMGV